MPAAFVLTLVIICAVVYAVVSFILHRCFPAMPFVLYAVPLVTAIVGAPSAFRRLSLRRSGIKDIKGENQAFLDNDQGTCVMLFMIPPYGFANIAQGLAEWYFNGHSLALCIILCALGLATIALECILIPLTLMLPPAFRSVGSASMVLATH